MLNLSLCWEKDDKINKKRPGFGPFKNVFAICGILCFKSHLFKSFDLHPSFVSYSFCSLLYTFSPRIFHSYFVGLNFLFILLPIDASPINYNLFINLPYFLSLLLSLSLYFVGRWVSLGITVLVRSVFVSCFNNLWISWVQLWPFFYWNLLMHPSFYEKIAEKMLLQIC